MFERLQDRVKRRAEQRVEQEIMEVRNLLSAALPPGVAVEAVPNGVLVSGRALVRRFALEPALRWLVTGPR